MKGKIFVTSTAALLAGTLFAAAQQVPQQPLRPGGQPAAEPPQSAEQLPPGAQQPRGAQPRQNQGTVGQGFQRDLPENQPIQPETLPPMPPKDLNLLRC